MDRMSLYYFAKERQAIENRRKLLKYLKNQDEDKYANLIKKLGLRK